MFKRLVIFILFFLINQIYAKNKDLNIYGWADYISPKVIEMFEEKNDIKINYLTFKSNEELYTKLKINPKGYDLIIPSSFMIKIMRNENMLHQIDKNKITNIKNLDPYFLNLNHDKQSEYSIPYFYGTVGILINRKYFPNNQITQWQDLWNPEYKNCLVLVNDMRDIFSIALKKLKQSINSREKDVIEKAYRELKLLLPNILAFAEHGNQKIYVNEDAKIGIVESGEALSIIHENPNIEYIIPKDGGIIWLDLLAIPKQAENVENAHKFIDFILQPEIGNLLLMYVQYPSPNQAAVNLLPDELKINKILNPHKKVIQKSEMQNYLGKDVQNLYLKFYHYLKLGI